MSQRSDTRLLVLHGLRLKGFGTSDDVAVIVGLRREDVTNHLDDLLAGAFVVFRDARLTGWSLTAAGRAEQERLLAEELETHGCRGTVNWAYQRFKAMNSELLTLCTAWQMYDAGPLNQHDDPAYDSQLVAKLGDLHERLVPVLVDLEADLARYDRYRPRFAFALKSVGAGDQVWFAGPMVDSYHTVWFQLHEDLLNTLGIERSTESEK